MNSRLLRWALWSPSHLGIAVGGVLVLILGVALVFRPSSGGTERANGVPVSATSSVDASGAPGDPEAPGAGDPSAAATTRPTVTAADAEEVTAARQTVQTLYRKFTVAWLGGLGAVSVPGWVDDVCEVGCTPFLRQMLGTVPPRSIPDAKVKKVVVDEIVGMQSVGRVQLSNGQWLRVTAEWDGDSWLVSGIEAE